MAQRSRGLSGISYPYRFWASRERSLGQRPGLVQELAYVLEAVLPRRVSPEDFIMGSEYSFSGAKPQEINQERDVLVVSDASGTHLHCEHVFSGCGGDDQAAVPTTSRPK